MTTHFSQARKGRALATSIIVAAGVLAAAPSQASATAAAIPDGAVMSYQRCMFGAPRTADSHEAWALRCQARTDAERP